MFIFEINPVLGLLIENDLGINEIIDCFEIDSSAGKIEPLIIKIIK